MITFLKSIPDVCSYTLTVLIRAAGLAKICDFVAAATVIDSTLSQKSSQRDNKLRKYLKNVHFQCGLDISYIKHASMCQYMTF